MIKNLICLFGILTVFHVQARDVAVTLWRGETHSAILYDYATIGAAPEGLTVREGVAENVAYLNRPFGTHWSQVADRVVWGSKTDGVRVFSVTASDTMAPGTYRCGDLVVTVLNRTLPPPAKRRYYLDLWQHPWAVARGRGVKPFSAAHYAAMKPLWEMLAKVGQKVLTTTVVDLPWNHQCYDAYHSMIGRVKLPDGTWKFDYAVFDEYVAFGKKCGIGPDIACYTMCPWDYAVGWEDESGKVHSARACPGTPAFEDFWGDFLVDFAAHLKEKGWLDHTFIALDERTREDVYNIVRFVQLKAPGLKVSFAGREAPTEFPGIVIDSCCNGLHRLKANHADIAAERRKKGMVSTYYVCCDPEHPNTFCSSEPEEAFWLGVYPAVSGLDGFLRWAWNSWPKNPLANASYTGIETGWKAGDAFLVYPDGSPSYRFLELANGIVAAEKLWILKEQGDLRPEIGVLERKFDRQAAMANRADFAGLRRDVLKVVNAELPKMKISVFDWTIRDVAKERGVPIREAADLLHRAGVTGFDCSYDCPELDAYARTALKPINLYANLRFLGPDRGKKEVDAAIANAVRYGVPRIMAIPENLGDGEPSDVEMDGIAEGLRIMVAKAAEKGVAITMEDFGNPKNPCSRAKCIKRLLDDVPGLGFAVDSGNLYHAGRGDDIVELARYAGRRIAHVHLKDWRKGVPAVGPDGKLNSVTIGTGAIPNDELVKCILESGFSGWYTLEHPVPGDTLGDVRRQISVLGGWLKDK